MQYDGEDNLDVLRLAKNYNSFLVQSICSSIDKKNMVVVDFGAGEGYIADWVEQNSGCKVVCIEPAENLQKYYVNKICYKSLDNIPDNSIDFIYSLNVLEHIADDVAVVDLFYQKLKQGGKIFLYLPALNILYSSMDKKVGHFRRYSKKMLKFLFSDTKKWQINQLAYADFAGFFVTLLYKLIGNQQGKISPASLKFYDRFVFPVSRFFDKITMGYFLGKNLYIKIEKK